MKFQNLKIEINDQQQLDEVVRELERLGYCQRGGMSRKTSILQTFYDGNFDYFLADYFGVLTTLAELKNLEAERHG